MYTRTNKLNKEFQLQTSRLIACCNSKKCKQHFFWSRVCSACDYDEYFSFIEIRLYFLSIWILSVLQNIFDKSDNDRLNRQKNIQHVINWFYDTKCNSSVVYVIHLDVLTDKWQNVVENNDHFLKFLASFDQSFEWIKIICRLHLIHEMIEIFEIHVTL